MKQITQQTLVNRQRLNQECEKLQVILDNPQKCLYCGTQMEIEDRPLPRNRRVVFFYLCPACKSATPEIILSEHDYKGRNMVKAFLNDRVDSSVFKRVLSRITKLGEITLTRCSQCSEVTFGVARHPVETCKKCMVKRLDQYERKFPLMLELLEDVTGVEAGDNDSFEQLVDKTIRGLRELRKEQK